MKFKAAVLPIITLIIISFLLSACESEPKMAAPRKWLADRTEQYLDLYKVAYDKVYNLQGTPHPCTKGHKAEEAARFHAALITLNVSYAVYRAEIDVKMKGAIKNDVPCRNTVSIVERLSKPFASTEQVNNCGRLNAVQAKTSFYIENPVEGFQAVKQLRDKIMEE